MLDQFLFEFFVNFEKVWIGKDYNINGINVCCKISQQIMEICEDFRGYSRN